MRRTFYSALVRKVQIHSHATVDPTVVIAVHTSRATAAELHDLGRRVADPPTHVGAIHDPDEVVDSVGRGDPELERLIRAEARPCQPESREDTAFGRADRAVAVRRARRADRRDVIA